MALTLAVWFVCLRGTHSENQDKPLEEWNKVQLLDDRDGDLHLKNLRVYEAESEQVALNLLFLGNINRVTSETPMNMVRVCCM